MGAKPLNFVPVEETKALFAFRSKSERDFWCPIMSTIECTDYQDGRPFRSYNLSEVNLQGEGTPAELRAATLRKLNLWVAKLARDAEDRPKLVHEETTTNYDSFTLQRTRPRRISRKADNVSVLLPATDFETRIFLYVAQGTVRLLFTNYNDANESAIEHMLKYIRTVPAELRWTNFQVDFPDIALKLTALRSLKFDPAYKIPDDVQVQIRQQHGESVKISFSNEIRIEEDSTKLFDLRAIPNIKRHLEILKEQHSKQILRVEGKYGEMTIYLDSQDGIQMKIRCYTTPSEVQEEGEFKWVTELLNALSSRTLVTAEIQSTIPHHEGAENQPSRPTQHP